MELSISVKIKVDALRKNGIVFYYWAKELESETKIIEEKTGRMTSYGRLKELSKVIESILAEQGHVNALPEWSDT